MKLRDKDKISLQVPGASGIFDGKSLLHSVESVKKQYGQGKWSAGVSLHGKKPINLNDLFSRIVVWIQKFVQIGDVAVQYDPGHAALPWAAIRFLLQVSINNVEKSQVILEGLEKASNLIVWGTLQEQLHFFHRTSDVMTRLWRSLEKMYELILQYLAKAIRFYSKPTTRK